MTGAARTVTGNELIAFLDAEARAQKMNASTASSRRSAVREVLNVAFGDAWETSPFEQGDVDALLAKFTETRQSDFTPETIQSYRSNFRRTVEIMLGGSSDHPADRWMTYRFPLRDSVAVEIRLPVDLSPAEANRLAALITALPVTS